jgi:hypothetical protein
MAPTAAEHDWHPPYLDILALFDLVVEVVFEIDAE